MTEKTYSLEELDAIDSEAVDAETANTYSLEDLERLDSWSDGSNVLKDTAVSFGKGLASDLVRIPDEIGSLLKETGEKGGAGMAIPSFNDGVNIARTLTGKDIELGKQDELLIKAGEMLSTKTKGFMGRMGLEPEEGSRLSQIAFDLGAGLSSVATSLGLLYATRSPSLLFGLFGGRQKGQIYSEAREAGKEPLEASILSSAAGLVEGGIEAIGGTAFLKAVSFHKFLPRAIFRAAEQGMEEGLQQFGEEAILSGVRKDNFNDVILRIGYAATLGVVLGVPAGAITTALEKTQVKKELRALGFSPSQADELIHKTAKKVTADQSVMQEVANFLEEEIAVTEKALNEIPKKEVEEGQDTPEENDIYSKNYEISKKPLKEQSLAKDITSSLAHIAEPISTTLKNINPKLKTKLRKYQYELNQRTLEDEKAVKPFLESYSKLSDREQADLDLALKNKDTEKIKEITKKNNMEDEYSRVSDTLTGIYGRAKETGLDVGFIEDYFPRKVKDVEGLMTFFKKQDVWPEMQKKMAEKEEKLGRAMTDDEKAEMLNTMLKGFPGGKAKPGNLKERAIEQVTPEINPFYQKSPQALLNYVYKLNDFIEARKFFGKSVKGSEMTEQALDESIGAFVLDLLQNGDISGSQAKEVSDVLKARFAARGPGGVTSVIRNITYIETMGSITSAITQIGDIAFPLYKSGFYQTGKALYDTLSGQAMFTKEDIGIERIAEEFSEKTKTAETLEWVFKHIGLEWMDRLGKETQINSSFERFSKLAENPTQTFKEEMKILFEEETEQVIEDLKNRTPSENVKFLLFSDLSDMQPISLSEMPQGYLKAGNARILYMLKTYTIKQIDVFRNEAFNKMKTNPAEGIRNLIKLSWLLMLANATADVLKDLLLNRELKMQDYLIDNLIRLFGVSKYTIYKAKSEGAGGVIGSLIVPPFGRFLSSGSKDIDKMLKGEFEPEKAEIINSVPLLGKIYYWWFGAGKDKGKKKKGFVR